MEFKNIFTNKVPQNTSRLRCETDDFDVTQSCLEALLIIEEESFEINKTHLQATHLAVKEQNYEILTEGFGDFMKSVVTFFKNLLEKFKEFMKKVFMVINAYIGDFDSFLSKYKDKFANLSPDFTVKGFEYTFNSSVPRLDKISNIIHDYNNEIEDLHNKTKSDIMKEREEFTSETFMNKIRSEVIGKGGETPSEEFVDQIKAIFRNGEDNEENIHVNKSYFSKLVDEYPKLKKVYTDTSKEKDNVIALIEHIKAFFEKSASVYYKGNTKVIGMSRIEKNNSGSGIKTQKEKVEQEHDFKKLEVINTFYSFKYVQAKEIGNICVTAMIEKTNALKEALKFHRVIIRKAVFTKEEDKKD